MCRAESKTALLSINDPSSDVPNLSMSKCDACGTCYFTDPDPVLGYNYSGFEQNYWYNYVQNGAGISAMLEPILAIDRPRQGSLLDIGCGFGFVPHFWNSMSFGEAIGLEMSSYGIVGAEKLGVTIVPKYYSEAVELHEKQFDYVFSSEVIEHVEDPEAFVKEISAALTDDGILIMTTPSASVLTPSSDYLVLLATLSPGFHFFVSSADAMRQLLRRCGFDHVEVKDAGHRLFVWASKVPLPTILEGFSDWPIYLRYLEQLSENSDNHVAGGALYRVVKDSFNLGMFDIAERLYPRFKKIAADFYDFDFDNVDYVLRRLRTRPALDNQVYPSWLGCGLLYAGSVEARLGASLERQISLYSAAIEVMEQEIELAAQFAGEAAYFLKIAKQRHKDVFAQLIAQDPTTAPDMNHFYILKHPGNLKGRDVCLYAAYAPKSKMTKSILAAVNALIAQDIDVILCLAVEDTTADFFITEFDGLAGVIVRENGGYDFSTWGCGTRLLPECFDARRLFFINDSVFVMPDLLPTFFEKVRSGTADIIAATESFQHQHHVQSYFLTLQGSALQSDALKNYWRTIETLSNKSEVVRAHELKLLARAKEDWNLGVQSIFGMQTIFPQAAFEDYALLNISHTYWDYLVSCGLPFVKVELFRDNPVAANILHWRKVFADHGASVSDALEHMAAPRSNNPDGEQPSQDGESIQTEAAPAKPKVQKSELQYVLSDINRVRLNARKRKKLRKASKDVSKDVS